jgi:hypothetical protein
MREMKEKMDGRPKVEPGLIPSLILGQKTTAWTWKRIYYQLLSDETLVEMHYKFKSFGKGFTQLEGYGPLLSELARRGIGFGRRPNG